MGRNTSLEFSRREIKALYSPLSLYSLLRVTFCCGSLSTSFYYRGLCLLGSCGVKEYEGPVLSVFPSVPWLPKSPWPVYYQESLAGAYRPWLAVTDRWSLRLTSMQIQFSLFISASWVLSCNGEAGVIYWVNLHFSGVARAMVMRESQLRWAAVLPLPLPLWHPPSWLKCHEGHTLLWCIRLCALLSSTVTSQWVHVTLMHPWYLCVHCLTSLGGITGLPSFYCVVLLSWKTLYTKVAFFLRSRPLARLELPLEEQLYSLFGLSILHLLMQVDGWFVNWLLLLPLPLDSTA